MESKRMAVIDCIFVGGPKDSELMTLQVADAVLHFPKSPVEPLVMAGYRLDDFNFDKLTARYVWVGWSRSTMSDSAERSLDDYLGAEYHSDGTVSVKAIPLPDPTLYAPPEPQPCRRCGGPWMLGHVCDASVSEDEPREMFDNVRCELCSGWHAPPVCKPRITLHLAEHEVQALRRALTRALAEHKPLFSQRLAYNRILDVIGRTTEELVPPSDER